MAAMYGEREMIEREGVDLSAQLLPAQPLPAQLLAGWPLAQWDGVHVLAASSGGADSVALVRALMEAKRAGKSAGRVFVGHVNHGLRGAASDADEAWLRASCNAWGVPFVFRRIPRETNRAGGAAEHSEDSLRADRYRLLTEMAEEVGARFVAVAHTRDDQAETVLFRLLRGSGLRGVAGMQTSRPLSGSVTLIRPLLASSRHDLRNWLHRLEQPWREDATNASPRYARNRIRNDVLPYLRENVGPQADDALLRIAEQSGEAQNLIDQLAEQLLAACDVSTASDGIALNVAPLTNQPPLLVAEALRSAWRAAGWPEQAMTHRWWRELAALAQLPGAQSPDAAPPLNLPGNVLARRAGSRLLLAPASSAG
jgi:tRNA(Ile)-lysidine synthase